MQASGDKYGDDEVKKLMVERDRSFLEVEMSRALMALREGKAGEFLKEIRERTEIKPEEKDRGV